MIVRQATLPWIPGKRSGGARVRARRRGMGDTQDVIFPWLTPAPGTSGIPFPCLPAGSDGPLAPGQNYCGGPSMSTRDNWDSKTAPTVSGVCFQSLFPFVGQAAADGSCVPVVNLPSPWPVIITAGLGAYLGFSLGFKLFGGRGR